MQPTSSLPYLFAAILTGCLTLSTSTLWAQDTDPTKALPVEHRIGVLFGVNNSVLDRPADPKGQPTLLSGSAFTGIGTLFGATWTVHGWTRHLDFTSGLIFAQHSSTGFEHFGSSKREITIEASTLRLPLWVTANLHLGGVFTGSLGTGLELWQGLTSSSTVREENISPDNAFTLNTVSVTTLHIPFSAEIEADLGKVHIPFRLAFSINPFTGTTTEDRFDDLQTTTDANGQVQVLNPGKMRMEFDYELLGTLGVRYAAF